MPQEGNPHCATKLPKSCPMVCQKVAFKIWKLIFVATDVDIRNRSSLIGLRNTDFFMNATRISSTGTLSSSLERRLLGVSLVFCSGEAHPYLELIITAARCATVRKT